MDPLADEVRWVEAALAGDRDAFARLVERYQGVVFGVCLRMLGSHHDAEDAAQEVFVRAYRRLESFDRSRRLSTWLLSVTTNYCIDRLRRRRFDWLTLDDVSFWLPSRDSPPEQVVVDDEDQAAVHRALQQLPETYRTVTVLRYWYDLAYEQIARVTGLTESAVKTRLHRARKMLAVQLAAEGGSTWSAETNSH